MTNSLIDMTQQLIEEKRAADKWQRLKKNSRTTKIFLSIITKDLYRHNKHKNTQ